MKRELFRKLFALFLMLVFLISPALSAEKIKMYGTMSTEHHIQSEPRDVQFVTTEEVTIFDEITIPEGSTVTAKVYQAQEERRWHRSGYFVCQITQYSFEDKVTDITDKEIYLVARKDEHMNGKDAAILSAELILTQAASIVGSCFIFFAPVDIAYFFTKGAITKEKNPNWFKSGVSCAYDNSIFWFWLKGKPIELQSGDSVKLKDIKKEKAQKLIAKLDKKAAKNSIKFQKKLEKRLKKQDKKLMKQQAREQKRNLKKAAKQPSESI